MMLAVLKTGFAVHGTSGNFNNHIGVPLTVFGLDTAHECAVFELGMSASGEIARLAEIVGPHIGVVLNVGPAHMEFFPSVEAIANAKMELFGTLDKDGTAVVNGDDTLLRDARFRCRCGLVAFAVESDADYRAENVHVGDNGCAVFEVEGNTVTLAVPGVHNVYNALAAYTVGRLLGIDGVMAAKAIGKVSAPAMRMEIAEKRGITFINDAYNANPLSMKSAADVLRRMRPANGGRRIAVLGSMLELGGISADAHRTIGAEYGRIGLAWLCLVGDGADDYRRGALESGMEDGRIRCFGDSAAAASFIEENTHAGDVVLVKGSRGIRMERVLAD
jgi:UDP-N-acetylmuramoyl-tripeptide--D-alanyl-D-alanine ligase